MPPWKRLLLETYLAGTMPYRRWAERRAAECGRAPIVVLFYHRVADDEPNDWTISNERFAWQIEWLRRHFDIVSLAEAQHRIASGKNDRAAACITFDDGYADNCRQALPLLIKERLPFTYFVTTENVLGQLPFPHDVERGRPLEPNTVEQLQALAAAGAEIGAHTRTHADLGPIDDADVLFDEVVKSARDLEKVVARPVRYFAFPFGLHANLNAAVFHLARDNGFAGVCSAYGGYNFPGDDAFHLQRIHADEAPARFLNWLTVDPRKLAVSRFRYGGEGLKTCDEVNGGIESEVALMGESLQAAAPRQSADCR